MNEQQNEAIMEDTRRLQAAKIQVEKERGFYSHALVYVLVMGGIWVFNYLTSPSFYWVIFPTLGWGIGLASHWLGTFKQNLFLGKRWEEKRLNELMSDESM